MAISGNHRQVYRDPISLFDAQRFQRIRTLANALVKLPVADVFRLPRIVTLPDDRGLVAAGLQVAIQAIARDIELSVVEPANVTIARRRSSSL